MIAEIADGERERAPEFMRTELLRQPGVDQLRRHVVFVNDDRTRRLVRNDHRLGLIAGDEANGSDRQREHRKDRSTARVHCYVKRYAPRMVKLSSRGLRDACPAANRPEALAT
jgi:hypothetical protein